MIFVRTISIPYMLEYRKVFILFLLFLILKTVKYTDIGSAVCTKPRVFQQMFRIKTTGKLKSL